MIFSTLQQSFKKYCCHRRRPWSLHCLGAKVHRPARNCQRTNGGCVPIYRPIKRFKRSEHLPALILLSRASRLGETKCKKLHPLTRVRWAAIGWKSRCRQHTHTQTPRVSHLFWSCRRAAAAAKTCQQHQRHLLKLSVFCAPSRTGELGAIAPTKLLLSVYVSVCRCVR